MAHNSVNVMNPHFDFRYQRENEKKKKVEQFL